MVVKPEYIEPLKQVDFRLLSAMELSRSDGLSVWPCATLMIFARLDCQSIESI